MTDEASLVDMERATDHGRRGLAAASAAGEVAALLEEALIRSGLKASDVASALNVTAGRVSQVFNGDGNLHIATVARFLDAMGHTLVIDATNADGVPLSQRRRPRRPKRREPEHATTRSWKHVGSINVVTVEYSTLHFYAHVDDAVAEIATWKNAPLPASAESYQRAIVELSEIDGSKELYERAI